jgi:demethylmenaquinone methyltransferase/2-methoxy-6-polyprenyl-1,4-benzoquinol methylase
MATAWQILRPGGVMVMHDFTYPANPLCRQLWRLYFGLMSMVAERVYPEWRTVFRELPDFLRQSPWLPESIAALEKQGFCDIRSQSLTWGAAAIVSARKP